MRYLNVRSKGWLLHSSTSEVNYAEPWMRSFVSQKHICPSFFPFSYRGPVCRPCPTRSSSLCSDPAINHVSPSRFMAQTQNIGRQSPLSRPQGLFLRLVQVFRQGNQWPTFHFHHFQFQFPPSLTPTTKSNFSTTSPRPNKKILLATDMPRQSQSAAYQPAKRGVVAVGASLSNTYRRAFN